MGRSTDTIVLGEKTYSVTQLPAMRAMRLQARLLAVFGPALSQLVAGLKDVKSLARMDVSLIAPALGGAVESLMKRLTPEEAEALVRELLIGATVTVRVDGKPDRQAELLKLVDEEFRGRLLDLYALLGFALQVNYADFIEGLKTSLGSLSSASDAEARAAKESPSMPPTPSSGQPTA
jgi:hypothetical protein